MSRIPQHEQPFDALVRQGLALLEEHRRTLGTQLGRISGDQGHVRPLERYRPSFTDVPGRQPIRMPPVAAGHAEKRSWCLAIVGVSMSILGALLTGVLW